MNRIAFSYVVNVLYVGLACWMFIELYYAVMELANIIQNKRVPFEVSINIIPFLLMVTVAVVSTVFYKIQKKKYKSLSFWMYPLLFPQEDEREKGITEKACRTTFISLLYVLPCAIGFLTFSPVVNLYIPGYPLYIVFFILFIQMTVFHVSLYRNKIA
ncbi:DUF2178 domain-containing protein [Bacillus pseudomycoides]|uniref:DUF2178 domain-containing protein n=1 Tax=Bacillus pseudomycoides TaxID=64104 RepID=A0AA91V8F0_9BACI|nr:MULTISPECIES: DUF2178 domain-containing protein [Bacillus]PEB53718.1 DUF2178 domain-containing protein [Bacillus sp. AFS098217]PED80324.1 DUF2178 domain-containing protein [Bacillus pseudomycoides]PEU10564.1 DUF2178 domain-containing protein [Bacillus sp. AFS019443]PEU19960.1 DUF2178 domain-containing protein [Bacillus sp. AFS014408]PFW59579.1 DUF2178 domain-containing protein [Bacillus sp. AFS075034]